MAKKKDQKTQEVIGVKDEFAQLHEKMQKIAYQNQKYKKDSVIEFTGANFAEVLNSTSAYSQAVRDAKTVLKDMYNYFSEIEVKVNKIQLKLAQMHCDNVDNGLTETVEVISQKDGE